MLTTTVEILWDILRDKSKNNAVVIKLLETLFDFWVFLLEIKSNLAMIEQNYLYITLSRKYFEITFPSLWQIYYH